MICYEGKFSLYCFCGTFGIIFGLLVPQIYWDIIPNKWNAVIWGPLFYYVLINMILRFFLRGVIYQIATRASFLGFICISSVMVVLYAPTTWKSLGIYGFFMAVFHYTEFLTIAWSNPASLSTDSFMLNHSPQYGVAAALSWLEFTIEAIFCPGLKHYYICWILGITICLFGEVMRKLAMITAKLSFNHLIQFAKEKEHLLITNGIYSIVRHPSYVGWFWWSIGTQIILCNPICIFLYAIASWKFFYDRIYLEEITLLNFFGRDYYEYQQRVPTGLPFIKGYQLE